jgi:hypothetical protein
MNPLRVPSPRLHLAVLAVLLCASCATLPHQPAERALFIDLRKIVELSESTGWVIDRIQVEKNAEDVMRSVCQVDPALRDDLEAWLTGQIEVNGGPAEQLYREHGDDLSAADRTLALERTRTLLRYGNAHAAQDCPFWLKPSSSFDGVQGDAHRFVVSARAGRWRGAARSAASARSP